DPFFIMPTPAALAARASHRSPMFQRGPGCREGPEVIPNESISLCIADQCCSKRLLFCTSDTLALRLRGEPRAPSGADSPQVCERGLRRSEPSSYCNCDNIQPTAEELGAAAFARRA